jgi:hypothetical protein
MSAEHQQQTGVGLSNGQVTVVGWRHLLLISASGPFPEPESANNSKTMRVGRKMSKEHLHQFRVSLSNGQVASARWRHLLLIPALGAFRDFQKRYYLGNGESWIRCFKRTRI